MACQRGLLRSLLDERLKARRTTGCSHARTDSCCDWHRQMLHSSPHTDCCDAGNHDRLDRRETGSLDSPFGHRHRCDGSHDRRRPCNLDDRRRRRCDDHDGESQAGHCCFDGSRRHHQRRDYCIEAAPADAQVSTTSISTSNHGAYSSDSSPYPVSAAWRPPYQKTTPLVWPDPCHLPLHPTVFRFGGASVRLHLCHCSCQSPRSLASVPQQRQLQHLFPLF